MPASILASRRKHDEALTLCRTAAEAGTQANDLRDACRIALEVAVASATRAAALQHAGEVVATALRRLPAFDDLRVIQAMIEHLQGSYDDEVHLYRTVLANQPQNPVVLNNLAWALSEGLNQPSEALEKIDELLAIAGPNPENLDTRGVILVRLGRAQEAVKDLEEAVKANASGLRLFHLAKAYKKLGRDDDARRLIERARQAGLNATTVDPTERPEIEALLKN
jgi:tetratricopeptide (TPR) repeat protein